MLYRAGSKTLLGVHTVNKTSALAAVLFAALGLSLAACEKKAETPLEKVTNEVKDGLDMRPHEKMKDAAEDVGDAMKDAGAAIKEEVKK